MQRFTCEARMARPRGFAWARHLRSQLTKEQIEMIPQELIE
jgi:hypothetical protein